MGYMNVIMTTAALLSWNGCEKAYNPYVKELEYLSPNVKTLTLELNKLGI